MKYSKELHEQLRRDLQEDSDDDAVFTYAAFECLLDEIERKDKRVSELDTELLMQKSLVFAREQDLNELHIELNQVETINVALRADIDGLRAEIDRLNAERRWIPVSERLPEIHDDYDGEKSDCCYAIDIHKCVWIAYYRPDEKDWYELPAGIILTAITHWMPLPEPPEDK